MTPIPVPQGVKILTVGELTRAVKGVIEDGFSSVWVSGEVSNLSRPASGHIYLTLKDTEAQLRAVIWRSSALLLRFDPREGDEVIARGRLSVYAPRGEYQFVVDELHPKGLGALELALRQLKEKLQRLGYFAPQRKKPLPRFPRRVALVTSPSGAAVRDMVQILARRWPAAEVWVCPVRVQGDGAGEEIAAAIRLVNQLRSTDVMVVGRGGGSSEDLWAFNSECVAHAIYTSQIAVVSAVGHEIDLTIADLVADCRALTPSEAAERIVPDRAELLAGVRALEEQIRTLLLQRLDRAGRKLEDLSQRRSFRLPVEGIRAHERKLDEWAERLQRGMRHRLALLGDQLKAKASNLETLSPLNVLGRGYSVTRREADGVVVRSTDQVRPGECLLTRLRRGQIFSRVEQPPESV
jgi:exodeoxyribonuclease VII large subunit